MLFKISVIYRNYVPTAKSAKYQKPLKGVSTCLVVAKMKNIYCSTMLIKYKTLNIEIKLMLLLFNCVIVLNLLINTFTMFF